MDRSVKIQLHPTPEQVIALQETLRQFTEVFNAVCTYGWQHGEKNGVRLHHATYYQLREQFPQLSSNVLIQARVKATEALKATFTKKSKYEANYPKNVVKALKRGKPVPKFKPPKCPQSKSCCVRYDQRHTYRLDWNTQQVSLSSIMGRLNIPFTVPPYSEKYYGGTICMAELCYRKGRWWLHVTVDVPEPQVEKNNEVTGIDLGLNHPAVTSTRHYLGNRSWKEIDRRSFRLKRKLQSKDTKSAKRHLKKLSKRQMHFHRDCDHVLSKQIVQDVTPGSTLVLENLTDIRETSKIGRGKQNKQVETKRRLHNWTFAQLYDFIAYKAQERGIRVERIDPRHTSQTCSRCGHQARNNRRSQSLFLCRQCGYQLNADLNAAYNIREKYLASLASLGISLASGLPSSSLSSQSSD